MRCLLLRLPIEVAKLVYYGVTIDLLMSCCPSLRKTAHWIELWRSACYPLSLSYAIVYSSLRVILFGSRCVKSSLIIILWLSLIYHWTIIDESLFNDNSRVEAAGDRKELVDD